MSEKGKVFLFGLSRQESDAVEQLVGKYCDIEDLSDCFMDVVVLPAKMVIINPEAMEEDDYYVMNDIFEWNENTLVVFSKTPVFFETVEHARFFYTVDDEIDNQSGDSRLTLLSKMII